MKRRDFIKTVGISTLSLGALKSTLSSSLEKKGKTSYDQEPLMWGSPYYRDTHSLLKFKKASYEEFRREIAHFYMSEKPRDIHLFEVRS